MAKKKDKDVVDNYLFDVDLSKMDKEDLEKMKAFINSPRGNYLISQALTEAIIRMEKVPKQYREISNLEDMKFLLKFFNLYYLGKKARLSEEYIKTFGLNMVCLNCENLWKTELKKGDLPKVCPECKSTNIRIL